MKSPARTLPSPSSSAFDPYQRSNSHNVIYEYQFFMTPRVSSPTMDFSKAKPHPSEFEYLLPVKKANKIQLKGGDIEGFKDQSLGGSSTSNKIKRMLMVSPYNNSKALANSLKSLKNLSQGSLLTKKNPINSGFLTNFDFSRKNLVKLAKEEPLNSPLIGKKTVISVNKANKEEFKGLQEENAFKNSISYKSTHNTSKSVDRQSEELFLLFNRAKTLLIRYKTKELEWKKEKEMLLKEILSLKSRK